MDAAQSTFSPLRKQQSVAETISAEILDLLRQKELKPGEKLPPERELAEMLGVSRPSLREALRALSIMKVVEMRQGDGTYVSDLRPEELVEHLDFVFMLDDSTMSQLFEARKVVEVANIGLAAQRMTDEELQELEESLLASERLIDDPDAFLVADIELHGIITNAARNPLLERFMASIGSLGRASRQKTVHIGDVRAITVAHHRQIFEALKAHDPDLAREAMLRHLEHVEKTYNESIE